LSGSLKIMVKGNQKMNRRNFFNTAAISAVAAASVSKVAMAALPEPALMNSPKWNSLTPWFMRQGRLQPLSVTTGL